MPEENDFNMQPVASENLAEVGFNPSTGQGRVLFNSGHLYEYDGCSQEEADAIIAGGNEAFSTTWRGVKAFRKIY